MIQKISMYSNRVGNFDNMNFIKCQSKVVVC